MSPVPEDLASHASRGALTTLMWQMMKVGTQLISTIFLARLLDPTIFGLFAMILAVTGVADLLRDFGLSQAAIQAKTLTEHQKTNLFWLNLAFGLILAAVVFAVAPAVSYIYREPSLTPLTRVFSVVFFINGASTQFIAELTRKMRFFSLNLVSTAPQVLALIVAIIWAVEEPSPWVLVGQQIVATSATLLLALALAHWWPGRPRRGVSMAKLLHFGIGRLGTQLLDYSVQNVDNLAIGAVYGSTPLGLYGKAYQLLMMPINQLLLPMTQVALPVLSRLQDDRERFMKFLLRGQLVGALAAGFIYGLVFGLAKPLVLIVFGAAWLPIVPILQALTVGGIFRALHQVAYWSFISLGLSTQQFRFYLVTQPILIVFLLAGLPWGPLGVAIGHSIGYILFWAVELLKVQRITGMDFRPLMVNALRLFCVVSLPTGTIGLVSTRVAESASLQILLGVAGSCVWFALVCLLSDHARRDVRDMLATLRRAKHRGARVE